MSLTIEEREAQTLRLAALGKEAKGGGGRPVPLNIEQPFLDSISE